MHIIRLAEKIEKANEIMKVKEDATILVKQCELYLKEKNEAVNCAKNFKESYEKRISDMQKEIDLKNTELESCHQQINMDKDNIKT